METYRLAFIILTATQGHTIPIDPAFRPFLNSRHHDCQAQEQRPEQERPWPCRVSSPSDAQTVLVAVLRTGQSRRLSLETFFF